MGCHSGLEYLSGDLSGVPPGKTTNCMIVNSTTSKLPRSKAKPLKRYNVLEDIVHNLSAGIICIDLYILKSESQYEDAGRLTFSLQVSSYVMAFSRFADIYCERKVASFTALLHSVGLDLPPSGNIGLRGRERSRMASAPPNVMP
jgi:hypothetical protein